MVDRVHHTYGKGGGRCWQSPLIVVTTDVDMDFIVMIMDGVVVVVVVAMVVMVVVLADVCWSWWWSWWIL